MQSLTAKIVEMDLQAVTSTGHTIDGKWERWREQLNKEYLDGVGNTERAYTELLLRTEEEKEREKIKLEIERITPPLSNSIPLRFIFSLEIAKALKIKRKEEPKNAKQTVSPYLTKASMLAKGTLRICELEESEKGKNDKKDENTRIPSHHAELVRFHIKDLADLDVDANETKTIELTITGEMADGTLFEGSDSAKVKGKKSGGGGNGTGRIYGNVTSGSDPVKGATVTCKSKSFKNETKTDANGDYNLENLKWGKYKVITKKKGYEDSVRAGIELSEDDSYARLNIELKKK